MKIIRAGFNDTDIFSKDELDYGACCFFTEDKAFRYFFVIDGQEATLLTNTENYIAQAIDEFLFYSGFVTSVKDRDGRVLLTRSQNESYLYEIAKIQPSQFFINEKKLDSCKKWIKSLQDIRIPIVIRDGKSISLDGHTRIRAAIELGYTYVYVYLDEYDESIFHFVDEAVRREVNSVADMELVSDEEYRIKWDKFCDDLFEKLKPIATQISINTQRLLLRTTRQEDLDAVASIWGDVDGGKYMPDPYYKSGTEIAEILDDDPDCPVYYLVAFRIGFDEVIGTCSLGFENADANEYSIGYTVKKDYWGNGYAVEMVHALIDFARELGIKSITAPVAQENEASNRVMEKCGFFIDGESSFKKSGTDIVYPTFIYRLNL